MIIILATIALMLLENAIGIKMYLTACLGAVLLVLTGVLSEKEALASIHQPTIFLFAACWRCPMPSEKLKDRRHNTVSVSARELRHLFRLYLCLIS